MCCPQTFTGLIITARTQWDHVRKLSACNVADCDAGDLDKRAQLHALALPGSLRSAFTEILVAQ